MTGGDLSWKWLTGGGVQWSFCTVQCGDCNGTFNVLMLVEQLSETYLLCIRVYIVFLQSIITRSVLFNEYSSCYISNISCYISDLLQHHEPARSLRLSSSYQLSVPRHELTFGSRAFRFSAPRVWNSLPVCNRKTKSLPHFQTSSKDILFSVGPSPFGCPSCLEYFIYAPWLFSRPWRYISHVLTYLSVHVRTLRTQCLSVLRTLRHWVRTVILLPSYAISTGNFWFAFFFFCLHQSRSECIF